MCVDIFTLMGARWRTFIGGCFQQVSVVHAGIKTFDLFIYKQKEQAIPHSAQALDDGASEFQP